jgi:serine protease Do
VIGINTAIATNTGSYSGIGFAIPVNVAKWVTGQLIKRGAVERAYLGVEIRPLTPDLAAAFQTPLGSGALVTKVHPNTPAAEAGLKAGDVVTKYGDTEVRGPAELQQLVERTAIDSKQKIEVIRDAKTTTLDVVAKPFPKDFALASRGGPLFRGEVNENESFEADSLGLQVADLSAEKAEEIGMKPNEGVLITRVDVNSKAYDQGLRQGMVIQKVNKKDVKSVEEFKAAVKEGSLKDGILLYVRARGGNDFVLLKE